MLAQRHGDVFDDVERTEQRSMLKEHAATAAQRRDFGVAHGFDVLTEDAKIAAALSDFADEPDAEPIARRIAEERQRRPITRTLELVDLVFAVKGLSRRKWREELATTGEDLHPAARTFQALRILVNDELAALRQLLRVAPACLKAGGRIGIVSFHSGEDRLVKHAFREGLEVGAYSAIAEDVIRPGIEERRANPRSASAKFRWAAKA